MTNDQLIGRDEIPHELIQEMIDSLKHFTVGFIKFRPGNPMGPQLLGTGTLVSYRNARGILTAQHVVEKLKNVVPLGLLLDQNQTTESLDPFGLFFEERKRGCEEHTGPDIALVKLSELHASTLGAKKSFFILDNQMSALSSGEMDFSEELWLSQGFVDERSCVREAPERECKAAQYHNLCGLGQPIRHYFDGGYDYVEFPYFQDADPLVPTSFGGTSGGALWHIPLFRNQDGRIGFRHPILRGAIFYQERTTPKSGLLRAHGPKTIYSTITEMLSPIEP
jgi:hypothetical protein